jgi:hypothetical protein
VQQLVGVGSGVGSADRHRLVRGGTVVAGGDALGLGGRPGIGDYDASRGQPAERPPVGQVGLGPRGDEPGDAARLMQVAAGVVDPVERKNDLR